MNVIQKQIVEGVEKDGWFSVSYHPGPDDPQEWFTYTVGLTKTAGWPELIVFNPDEALAITILRNTIGECWGRKIEPEDNVLLSKVLNNNLAKIRRFDFSSRHFAMADWYSRHSGTQRLAERLQVMWPDKDGRFPNEPGCDPKVRDWQTPMGVV